MFNNIVTIDTAAAVDCVRFFGFRIDIRISTEYFMVKIISCAFNPFSFRFFFYAGKTSTRLWNAVDTGRKIEFIFDKKKKKMKTSRPLLIFIILIIYIFFPVN